MPISTTISAQLPPWIWPRAAYVHIPFCAHACGYCDFAIATGEDHRIDIYLEALSLEFATLGEPQPVDTLFIGGGTPSQLSARQLERLLTDMRRWLLPQAGYEWSIEANPDSLVEDKVRVLADHGITRVSLGAQSFHPHLLKALDRRHTPAEVPRAVERIRRHIAEVSVDLIFAVPGQTAQDWQEDLRQALALEPDHLSTYGLTYEKGTPLWKERERGQVRPVTEDDELHFYRTAIDTLEAAGYEHYEISNFARRTPTGSRRCRHNEVYWANHAYFGFGMGAARYVRGRRELNTRNLDTYLRKILSGESALFQSEELDAKERAKETMAVQLRRSAGIERGAYREQSGFELDGIAGEATRRFVALGLLQEVGTSIRLTKQGKFVADGIIEGML